MDWFGFVWVICTYRVLAGKLTITFSKNSPKGKKYLEVGSTISQNAVQISLFKRSVVTCETKSYTQTVYLRFHESVA
jgi:hypothetical protein